MINTRNLGNLIYLSIIHTQKMAGFFFSDRILQLQRIYIKFVCVNHCPVSQIFLFIQFRDRNC